MQEPTEKSVILGYISGLYGIKGWVKVFSYTQPKENILTYSPWTLQQQEVVIESGQVQGKSIVAKLRGFDDRDSAAKLLQQPIKVARERLHDLQSDEYYWVDLIGLSVINRDGKKLGTVSELFATGANDVVVVKAGEQEHLLPFLKWVILDIDLEAGMMRVDWDTEF